MTAASVPPEHPSLFWPRLVALAVDYILASALGFLVLLPFAGDTDRLRLDAGFLRVSDCAELSRVTAEVAALVAPETIAAALRCDNRVLGLANGQSVTIVYGVTRTEHTSSQKSLTVPVNAQGRPVTPLLPQSTIAGLILIFCGAGFLARSGQTPGKRLMRLSLSPTGYGRAVLREVLKLFPLLLVALGLLGFGLLGQRSYELLMLLTFKTVVLGALAWVALIILWYLVPVLRWRGAMTYDRLLGLTVTRPPRTGQP